MRANFYHFKAEPFLETPNTEFYFSSKSHIEALEKLANHLDSGSGFVAITGEVGTGKTMLTRYLIKMCEEEIDTAYIYWPSLNQEELIETISREFGLEPEKRTFQGLEEFLISNNIAGRKSVLFIDEAQSLPYESLEMIRLISNLESETKKLIQIVLLGQPELDQKLKEVKYRQISQRISLRLNLTPLPFRETEAYIKHRIEIARGSNAVRFELKALKTIFHLSKGIPRLINLICRTALNYGAKNEIRIITEKAILCALKESNLIDKKVHFFKRPEIEVAKSI